MSATIAAVPEDRQPTVSAAAGERRSRWGELGFWILAIIIGALLLLPIYVLFKVSVSTLAEATAPRPSYFPREITWANWERLLRWDVIGSPLQHSLIVSFSTAIIAILIAAPAAYVISRLPRGPRYLVVLGLLLTRMFPEVIIATPIAANFFAWGLNDTNLGLTLRT